MQADMHGTLNLAPQGGTHQVRISSSTACTRCSCCRMHPDTTCCTSCDGHLGRFVFVKHLDLLGAGSIFNVQAASRACHTTKLSSLRLARAAGQSPCLSSEAPIIAAHKCEADEMQQSAHLLATTVPVKAPLAAFTTCKQRLACCWAGLHRCKARGAAHVLACDPLTGLPSFLAWVITSPFAKA